MKSEEITWALLAPVSPRRLTKMIDEYWLAEVDPDEEAPEDEGWRAVERWEVIAGTGEYSALLDRTPGSEGPHDVPLAERISRKVKRPVYVLYLNEDYEEAEPVFVYKAGRQTGTQDAPYEQALSLGISLPGDFESEPGASPGTPTPITGVVVIEGVSSEEVARALKVDPQGLLRVEDVANGAIVYNTLTGDAPAAMWLLSRAFRKSTVYTLSTGPDKDRFLAMVMRGGKDLGTFDYPEPPDPSEGPVLESIKGETEPRRIIAALGIPPGLLSLANGNE